MLLDTHVLLWLAAGVELSEEIRQQVGRARDAEGVFVSAVSVWEVGNLVHKGKVRIGMPMRGWLASLRTMDGLREVDLSSDIAVDAARLPEPFHHDPADRFLVSTARNLDIPLLTRDPRILQYADQGHVRAMSC
ncbi:MAG TPA: type II toxin-antitoxin system VapC family toxin [Xanthobacteraceae bacterium]|jgi:PIN domain nuclease of toxin-antitoxin system